jgi:bifunctional protein TilS/HprT
MIPTSQRRAIPDMLPFWITRVQEFLSRFVQPEDRLLLAVSGGADSMGLMALLADELGYDAKQIAVCHINHTIRTDAAEDLIVVQDAASARSLPVFACSVDAPRCSRLHHWSLEAAARKLRYQSLAEIADAQKCRWILTAHTQDDSAETVLMRMQNRAPWYEWTGIPAQRNNILRPLLDVSRYDLRLWIASRKLAYREDHTNRDLRFARNRLRADLQERPDFWTPDLISQYAKAGRDLEEALLQIKGLCNLLPVRFSKPSEQGRIGLAIDKIFRYFNDLTFLPIEAAWAELIQNPEARLPSAMRKQIVTFLAGKSPQAILPLPHKITLLRRGSQAWLFVEDLNLAVNRRVSLGSYAIPEYAAELRIEATESVPNTLRVRNDLLQRELWLRNWLPGDRIQLAARPNKKVSDLLSELKLDPMERARTLVLADAVGPLMIMGRAVALRALSPDKNYNTLCISWTVHDGNGAENSFRT